MIKVLAYIKFQLYLFLQLWNKLRFLQNFSNISWPVNYLPEFEMSLVWKLLERKEITGGTNLFQLKLFLVFKAIISQSLNNSSLEKFCNYRGSLGPPH